MTGTLRVKKKYLIWSHALLSESDYRFIDDDDDGLVFYIQFNISQKPLSVFPFFSASPVSDPIGSCANQVYLLSMQNAGLWNYQILFLVHGQVNGRNPLVQPRFTYPKIGIYFLFLEENICCGYSLEYPQHMFF